MHHQGTGLTNSERELIARCKRGDRQAQRDLYGQTSERVFRLLTRMTHSAEAAEDLAQETYLKAFAAIAKFDERSSVNTWLYRIAVNEALQWLRRKLPVPLDPGAAAARPDSRANGQDPSVRLDVERAMATLDPIDRTMLLLRYQEGLDYRAIAEVTGIAMGTVASRLNRARERLRELLADFTPEREETGLDKHRIGHGRVGDVGIARPVEGRVP
ncbi:MAG: sigma-70 family RNA polymerase sigma factor [Phycisphaerae bacterium]|nr:sigma-70 family RNA polymerase sigma factor [Phycisphaerae bacterium]